MTDTRGDAQIVVDDATRRRAPIERLRGALRLSDEVRSVALAAMRRRYSGDSVVNLVERMTGEPLTPSLRHGPRRA